MSKDKRPSDPKKGGEPPLEELIIGGAVYQTRITKKFRNRTAWKRPDKMRVEAVIPGTIQRILVEEGQEVSAGEPLLILEAMKMRNEVLSPVTGSVKHIYVREGEHVPKARLLIELA